MENWKRKQLIKKLVENVIKAKDKGKQMVPGRVVKNNALVKIAIVGNPRYNSGTKPSAWLWPGQSSFGQFEDVDSVMIAPGQRFYESKGEMERDGRIVTSGAIKVRNNWTVAEVAMSGKRPDVFYVNAMDTTYLTAKEAKDLGWKLPD